MKTLFLAVALVAGIAAFAQKAPLNSRSFIRVYDLEGEKFSDGKIRSFSDTTLLLSGEQLIDPAAIGLIKTKRSTGNNVLIGTISAAILGGIIAAAEHDPDEYFASTPEGDFMAGFVLSAPVGALLGWLSSFLKDSRTFIINGDLQKWRDFQNSLDGN